MTTPTSMTNDTLNSLQVYNKLACLYDGNKKHVTEVTEVLGKHSNLAVILTAILTVFTVHAYKHITTV